MYKHNIIDPSKLLLCRSFWHTWISCAKERVPVTRKYAIYDL